MLRFMVARAVIRSDMERQAQQTRKDVAEDVRNEVARSSSRPGGRDMAEVRRVARDEAKRTVKAELWDSRSTAASSGDPLGGVDFDLEMRELKEALKAELMVEIGEDIRESLKFELKKEIYEELKRDLEGNR
eukprot:Polyplicarium_translucidae@DN4554_c0_g1_i1.p1